MMVAAFSRFVVLMIPLFGRNDYRETLKGDLTLYRTKRDTMRRRSILGITIIRRGRSETYAAGRLRRGVGDR
jgi:hypothetical protein